MTSEKNWRLVEEKLIEFGIMEMTAGIIGYALENGYQVEVRQDGRIYFMGEDSDYDYESFVEDHDLKNKSFWVD